jgi:hypothetical protein
MRRARVIFRPEGIQSPRLEELHSIMFLIDLDARPSTSEDCRSYEQPIRIWLDRTYPGDDIVEIWFSHPEHLHWPPHAPRNGQDIVVEGGLILTSGHRDRFCLELHAVVCDCASCQDEDCVEGDYEWITLPNTPR